MGSKFITITGAMMLTLSLQGCVPLIVMHEVNHEQDHQHYSEYVTQTEQINFERQKVGLQPDPIMTFAQWNGN